MFDAGFKALADPTRRRIIEFLARKCMTAGEIAAHFPVAFASVSHHLGVLRQAGLVTTRREGQHIRYRLDSGACDAILAHLSRLLHEGHDV